VNLVLNEVKEQKLPKKRLSEYEAVFIIDPKLEDEKKNKVIDKFEKLIKKHKGEVEKINKWGIRKLAYPIAGNTDGFYAIVNFKAEAKLISELDRVLHITDEVIRHMIVRS